MARAMPALPSIAALLYPCRAKPSPAETINRMLQGEEFFPRQRIALAGIIQAEKAAPHGRDNFGFAPNDPTPRRRRRQIGERQRRPIRADDIAHASFALFHCKLPTTTRRNYAGPY